MGTNLGFNQKAPSSRDTLRGALRTGCDATGLEASERRPTDQ
jgi:hypothetical protein